MKSVNDRENNVRHNIRLLYFGLAGFVLIAGITAAILLSVVIFSTGPSLAISADEKAIISRTLEITKPQTQTQKDAQLSNIVWQEEIASGQLTVSEFLRISFTGTQYLLRGKDDAAFAKDLAKAVYGGEGKFPARIS